MPHLGEAVTPLAQDNFSAVMAIVCFTCGAIVFWICYELVTD
jgi:hypothetical protein